MKEKIYYSELDKSNGISKINKNIKNLREDLYQYQIIDNNSNIFEDKIKELNQFEKDITYIKHSQYKGDLDKEIEYIKQQGIDFKDYIFITDSIKDMGYGELIGLRIPLTHIYVGKTKEDVTKKIKNIKGYGEHVGIKLLIDKTENSLFHTSYDQTKVKGYYIRVGLIKE